MCGIVALRSARGPIRVEALERATSALRHRGPDGEGIWTSASQRVGLGHTRLAIMARTIRIARIQTQPFLNQRPRNRYTVDAIWA